MSTIKRFQTKRKGALGALMDLYEEEAEFLIQTINALESEAHWTIIVDPDTKDEDCRSIQTICQHIVGAANYYVDLMKRGEDKDYVIPKEVIKLDSYKDFEPALRQSLTKQAELYKGRWALSDEEISKIVIKTGWGITLDPEALLEHAILHIMRHHRQLLRFIEFSKTV